MGAHPNITKDKFPAQGNYFGKEVELCFHYDNSQRVKAKCIRDDKEDPGYQIFQELETGRVILATECMWRPL